MGPSSATRYLVYNVFGLVVQNLTKEMADYCVARMKPYVEPKTERPITNALDYIDFTRTLFQN